jgi:hypothetical protein
MPNIDFDREVVELSDDNASRLRKLNIGAGALHLVTGLAMILAGDLDFELPVSGFNISGPPGTALENGVLNEFFGIPLALGVALFSALFHFLIAFVLFGKYKSELRRGRNRFRWVEYALSSTLMMVLIAATTGITDLAALIALAFANISMILFGWIMEMVNSVDKADGTKTWWTPFWFGCIAGIGPWLAILIPLWLNVTEDGAEGPPGFVYGIIVSIFFFFNTFAINQWLQYKGTGRWADYLHGERAYIILSFVAKSVLAWQIFANTLIP